MKYLHTAIRVTDLERSLSYYCDTLGMIEVRRLKGHHRPCDIIFLAMPEDNDAQIELIYYHDENYRNSLGAFRHVGYEVENIYEACRNLMDKGITLNLPPRDGFMAFFTSPDGIAFELLQKGGPLPAEEPWMSMPDQGTW